MWFGFAETVLDLQVIGIQALASAGTTSTKTLSEAELVQIRLSVWRLHKAIGYLAAEDLPGEFAELFRAVAGSPDELFKQILAWTDIIHTLMQQAEHCYGSGSGRGRLKARRVKAAVLQFARRTHFDIPKVPAMFEPLILSLTVDLVLKILVRVQNKRGAVMWGAVPEHPSFLRRFGAWLGDHLTGLLERAGEIAGALVWKLALSLNPLSPGLQKIVDELVNEQPDLLTKPMAQAKALSDWLFAHTAEIGGLVEAFAIAVEMAEDLVETGERKKLYARELVIAFLELSFIPRNRSAFLDTLLRFVIDTAIETLVHIFRKQGLFEGKLLVNVGGPAGDVSAQGPST